MPRRDVDDRPAARLAERAATRSGVFSLDDARACGLSDDDVRRMVVQGWWRVLHRGVYCAQGMPVTPAVREAAALVLLGERSWLTGFSAAAHQRLDVADLVDHRVWLEVPFARGRVCVTGLVVARTRHPVVPVVVAGLRMTPVPRTVLSLAAHLDRSELARLVSEAVRAKPTTAERVLAACEGMGGRPGVALLRSVCAEVDPLFESVLEEEAKPVLLAAGLADLEQQVELSLAGTFLGRVDFFVRELGLAIEIDGWAHHSSAAAKNRDARRDRRLLVAGVTVVRFTADDVRRHPERMVAELRQVVAALRRRTA